MATLRLFAAAREAIGVGSMDVAAPDVRGVIASALARPGGPRLAELLPTCTIWLNGDAVALDAAVTEGDEVALLPPVSGGS